MTKFIIVRHGQSEANLKEIYAGRFNVPLTETGRKQAALVTEYVLKTYRVDAVFSSPLLRTRETVKKISEKANVPLQICEGIAEIYGGDWEGKTLPGIAKTYTKDALLWKNDIGNSRPTGGESFAEVQARADKALRDIAKTHENQNVVIGTHGGVIRIPLIGGLVAPTQGLFPKYDQGKFTVDGRMTLIITSGLAGYACVPRVCNRPEVCVVDLIPEEGT